MSSAWSYAKTWSHPSEDKTPSVLLDPYVFKKREEESTTWKDCRLCIDRCGFYLLIQEDDKETVCIDLAQVSDVRNGIACKDGRSTESSMNATEMVSDDKCFTIVYGPNLTMVSLLWFCAESAKFRQEWVSALLSIVFARGFINPSLALLIKKQYQRLLCQLTPSGKISVRNIAKTLLCGKSERLVRTLEGMNLIQGNEDEVPPEKFTFNDFFKLYTLLCPRQDIDHVFMKICGSRAYLTAEKLMDFVDTEQRDPRLNEVLYPMCSRERALTIIKKYETCKEMYERERMSMEGLMHYLMSQDNLVVNPQYLQLNHDMNRSLSCYYIYSSHNTYLVGRQWGGKSSVEIYRQCLLAGCRCIELDCWDGPGSEPIITHGKAMCTSVYFKEVILAIKESAFVTSPYPVILSFENRCSLSQQKKLAQYCVDIFGEMLLSKPLDNWPLEEGKLLPPPSQLLYKILIKNKKLKVEQEMDESFAESLTETAGEDPSEVSGDAAAMFEGPAPSPSLKESSMLTIRSQNFHKLPVISESSAYDGLPQTSPNADKRNSFSVAGDCGSEYINDFGTPDSSLIQSSQKETSLFSQRMQFKKIHSSQFENSSESGIDLNSGAEGDGLSTKSATSWSNGLSTSFAEDSLTIEASSSPLGVRTTNRSRSAGSSFSMESSTAANWMITRRGENALLPQDMYDSKYDRKASVDIMDAMSLRALRKLSQASRGMSVDDDAEVPQTSLVTKNIHPALSKLVNYVQPIPFQGFAESLEANRSYLMSSFNETDGYQLIKECPVEFLRYNKTQLSRIYPKGTRVDSSNYNPQIFWNSGCQLAALNLQTPDTFCQLNNSRFEVNGQSGYLLKPDIMIRADRDLDPFTDNVIDGVVPATLVVRIISGQYLTDRKCGTYAMVELFGLPTDTSRKRKTKLVPNNGINPIYSDEVFHFDKIILPELALIRLAVFDDNNRLIGQRVCPLDYLQAGYRHVPLRTEHNQNLPLASLFVHITLKSYVPQPLFDFVNELTDPIRHRSKAEERAVLMRKYDADDIISSVVDEEFTPAPTSPSVVAVETSDGPCCKLVEELISSKEVKKMLEKQQKEVDDMKRKHEKDLVQLKNSFDSSLLTLRNSRKGAESKLFEKHLYKEGKALKRDLFFFRSTSSQDTDKEVQAKEIETKYQCHLETSFYNNTRELLSLESNHISAQGELLQKLLQEKHAKQIQKLELDHHRQVEDLKKQQVKVSLGETRAVSHDKDSTKEEKERKLRMTNQKNNKIFYEEYLQLQRVQNAEKEELSRSQAEEVRQLKGEIVKRFEKEKLKYQRKLRRPSMQQSSMDECPRSREGSH